MSTAQVVRWALFAWIGGPLSIIPLLAVAGWAMRTKARLRARSRRNHPAERARQRQATAHIRANANRVIARDQAATFLAHEQDYADWQRERAARDVYDWKQDEGS